MSLSWTEYLRDDSVKGSTSHVVDGVLGFVALVFGVLWAIRRNRKVEIACVHIGRPSLFVSASRGLSHLSFLSPLFPDSERAAWLFDAGFLSGGDFAMG